MTPETVPGRHGLVHEMSRVIHEKTYGRVRDLAVREEDNRVVVHGRVPSQHLRQLALHAAMSVAPSQLVAARFTVA